MIKKCLLLLTLIFFFIFTPQVKAENITTATGALRPPDLPGDNYINSSASAKSGLDVRNQMQVIQQQKKGALVQAKEELNSAIQAKKAKFADQIKTIKDQKKKMLLQMINDKLSQINKNRTEALSQNLARMQEFLDKAKTNANADTAAVALAQTAIDKAKAAIDAQAAKSYIMNLSDETQVRIEAKNAVDQLRQDLTSVYKIVIDAKQAVQKLYAQNQAVKKATGSAIVNM